MYISYITLCKSASLHIYNRKSQDLRKVKFKQKDLQKNMIISAYKSGTDINVS